MAPRPRSPTTTSTRRLGVPTDASVEAIELAWRAPAPPPSPRRRGTRRARAREADQRRPRLADRPGPAGPVRPRARPAPCRRAARRRRTAGRGTRAARRRHRRGRARPGAAPRRDPPRPGRRRRPVHRAGRGAHARPSSTGWPSPSRRRSRSARRSAGSCRPTRLVALVDDRGPGRGEPAAGRRPPADPRRDRRLRDRAGPRAVPRRAAERAVPRPDARAADPGLGGGRRAAALRAERRRRRGAHRGGSAALDPAGVRASGRDGRVGSPARSTPWPPGVSAEDEDGLRISAQLAARDASAAVPGGVDAATRSQARRAAARPAHLLALRHAFAPAAYAELTAPWRPWLLPPDAVAPPVRGPARRSGARSAR